MSLINAFFAYMVLGPGPNRDCFDLVAGCGFSYDTVWFFFLCFGFAGGKTRISTGVNSQYSIILRLL